MLLKPRGNQLQQCFWHQKWFQTVAVCRMKMQRPLFKLWRKIRNCYPKKYFLKLFLKLCLEGAGLPDKMCVQAASSLCSLLSASNPACKAPTGFPGVSGDQIAIREGCLQEGLGAVWFEKDLTQKGVSVHCCCGKPCCREPVPRLTTFPGKSVQ